MSDAGAPTSRFLDPPGNRRVLAAFEKNLGYILCAFGLACFVMWRRGSARDRHGMIFVFLAGTFILPFGALLALAGNTLRRRGRSRWVMQLLVIAWPVMYWAFFHWVL